MFDPYHRWLGIPPGPRPPTYYQLLGIAPDEADPEVIKEAAVRQTSRVRLYQVGPHAAQCTNILNEIGQARATLLNPEKRRQYDASLAPPPPVPETTIRPPPPPLPEVGAASRAAPQQRATAVSAVREDTPDRGVLFHTADTAVASEAAPLGSRGLPRRPREGTLVPALCFADLLLAGAGLAFGIGLGGPAPAPSTPAPKPDERQVNPAPLAAAPYEGRFLKGHQAAVRALAVSTDAALVFSAGGSYPAGSDGEALDCALRQWGRRAAEPLTLYPGHRAPVHCLALSPDGKHLLSGGGGFGSHDGTPVASDCVLRLWDVGTVRHVRTFAGHPAPVRGAAFRPDGFGVVSCSSDGTLLAWNIRGRPLPRPLGRDPSPADCLAVSPRGRFAVVGGRDGQLRLWDLFNRQELVDRFEPDDFPLFAVAFSPDGKRILSAGGTVAYRDGKAVPAGCAVRVWDLDSGNRIRELSGHTRPVQAVAWSGDGRLIASGSLDGTVRLWQARGGKLLHVLEAGSGVTCVALTGDGRLLAGTLDGVVRSWEVERVLASRRGDS